MKLDLETLKRVKSIFDIHSDHSTMCNGYRTLCRMIEKQTNEQKIEEEAMQEYKKCIDSPYYFYTNYATINGTKATTNLTEQEFNNQFNQTPKKEPTLLLEIDFVLYPFRRDGNYIFVEGPSTDLQPLITWARNNINNEGPKLNKIKTAKILDSTGSYIYVIEGLQPLCNELTLDIDFEQDKLITMQFIYDTMINFKRTT